MKKLEWKLPLIFKEVFGEEVYDNLSKYYPRENQKQWVLYGSAEFIEKLEKMMEEFEFPKNT